MSDTIKVHRNYSTKRLARELGIPRAELLETLRNNEVAMDWHAETRTWRIRHRADAETAVLHYRLEAEDDAAEAARGERPATRARKARVRAAHLALEAAVDAADEHEHEGARS